VPPIGKESVGMPAAEENLKMFPSPRAPKEVLCKYAIRD